MNNDITPRGIRSTVYPDVQLSYNEWIAYIHTGKLPYRKPVFTQDQYIKLVKQAQNSDDIINIAQQLEEDQPLLGLPAYIVISEMLNYKAQRV